MVRGLLLLGALLLPAPALGQRGDASAATSLWRAFSLDLQVVLPMLLVAGV